MIKWLQKLNQKYGTWHLPSKLGFWGFIFTVLSFFWAIASSIQAYIKSENNFPKIYAEGKSFFESKQYEKALPYYEDLYKGNANIPNSIYEYGRINFKIGDYSKAISIWQNVPSNEKHPYYHYYLGISYLELINLQPKEKEKQQFRSLALQNFENAISDLKSSDDKAYWYSRLNFILLDSYRKSSTYLVEEINQFEIDRRSVLGVYDTLNIEVGTDFSIFEGKLKNSVEIEVVSEAALFKLYQRLSDKYIDEGKILESIISIMKALEYRSMPIEIVNNLDIVCILRTLSLKLFELQFNDDFNEILPELEKILFNAYIKNSENRNFEIADTAAIFLNVYFKKNLKINALDSYKDNLYLALTANINDKEGLKKVSISSISYPGFNKVYELDGKKEFNLSETQTIEEISNYGSHILMKTEDIDSAIVITELYPYLPTCNVN